MIVGTGNNQYEWIEHWARIPASESGKTNGRTHGAAVSKTGNVIIFNQANPGVLIFSPQGKLISNWGDRFSGAHGLSLVEENGTEYLWLADQDSGEVVKTTLDGKTVLNLKKHDSFYPAGKAYVPTWVSVNETRLGGNGDVWVTDGYGSSYIHRYDSKGNYKATLTGEAGAGRFACPHCIWFNTRSTTPELYVADRGNERIQVYDGEGKFKRSFGEGQLAHPCSFASHGGKLFIPGLFARLSILDDNDKVIAVIGDQPAATKLPNWPNVTDDLVKPGYFNSPHGIAADAQGNIYIVEWIVGGRITKLAKR